MASAVYRRYGLYYIGATKYHSATYDFQDRKKWTKDMKIEYLEEYNKIKHTPDKSLYYNEYQYRHEMVQRYAWAIPNEEAIMTLKRYSPILEIGAGKGYWAMLMREVETAVQAFDLKSSEEVPGSWSTVFEIYENTFKYTKDWTLFLCWPPYEESMAYDAITRFDGEHVIYIGEGYGGYTADDKFHDYLYENFVQIHAVKLPQWDGIHDDMTIWERLIVER